MPTATDRSLLRHLGIAVVVKLLLLVLLWALFVRGAKVPVDGARMAEHLVAPARAEGEVR